MPDLPATQPASVVGQVVPQPTPAPTSTPTPVAVPPAVPPAVVPQAQSVNQFVNNKPVTPKVQAIAQPNDKKYATLLDVLSETGDITPERANALLAEHIRSGRTIEDLIREKKEVSNEALAQAKGQFYKIPYVNLSQVGIYPEALGQLSESLARYYKMLPFVYTAGENSLSVAMENPLDLTAVDFVEQKTGLKLKAYYASPEEIERKLAENYSQSLSSEVQSVLDQNKSDKKVKEELEDLNNLSGGMIRQAPINKIVQTVLSFALKSRASDVHIEVSDIKGFEG